MEKAEINKYFFIALFAVLAFTAYLVLHNFINILLSALLLAYICIPLKNFFKKKLGNNFSALLVVLLILSVLFFVVYFLSNSVFSQISYYANQQNINNAFSAYSKYLSWLPQQAQEYINNLRGQAGKFLLSVVVQLAAKLPQLTLATFLTIFISYYILAGWESMISYLKRIDPFPGREDIFKKVGFTATRIIYGYLAVSALDFSIACAGFYLAGLKTYLVLSLLIGVSAFVPVMGPASIWIPAFVLSFLAQNYLQAGIILATGLLISIGVDHFVGYVIVGKASKVHPVVMLLGVVGGIPLFGILGFILGPVVLVAFLEILGGVFAEPLKNQHID